MTFYQTFYNNCNFLQKVLQLSK